MGIKYIEVITTFEIQKEAEKMAQAILEAKLGACCSIEEIESLYRWRGKIEKEKEFQLTIKTKANLYKKLEGFIKENHSYETPQIISIPILGGSSNYLDWLNKETK